MLNVQHVDVIMLLLIIVPLNVQFVMGWDKKGAWN
jgi:hypothetical protein